MEGGEKPRTRRASRRIIHFWEFASEHTGVGRPWKMKDFELFG